MYTSKVSYRIQYGLELYQAVVHYNGEYIGSTTAFSVKGIKTQIQAIVRRNKGTK